MNKLITVIIITVALTGCDLFKHDNTHNPEPTPPIVVTPEDPPIVEETRKEMIERELNLPPEPDETENNATILGIDVNENNIRDDVERKIAFDLYDNPPEMKREMRYAEIWTEVFHVNGDQDKLFVLETEALKSVACSSVDVQSEEELMQHYNSMTDYGDVLNNSIDRRVAYAKASQVKRPIFSATDEEIRTYCSQFNN